MITELSCGNASAKIDSKGAELKSLIIGGREIMWNSDPAFWGKSSPVLFPAIGNVKANKTVIDGKTIDLPKHGFARDNEFSRQRLTPSSVVYSYSYFPKDGQYPYKCMLSISYSLYVDKLVINYYVFNSGNKTMAFCIGAHPAIACKNLDNCTIKFEKRENASTPVMNLKTRLFESENRIERLKNSSVLQLAYDMFDNDVVYFDDIKSRSVTFKEGSRTLATISFTGFDSLGLWTPAGKRAGFLCIEPWCGSDDYDNDSGVFAEKKGIQLVGPHKRGEYSMTISAK